MGYVKELTKEFSEVLSKVNKGEGTMGKLINDDELYYETVRIVRSADTSLITMVAFLAGWEVDIFNWGLNWW